MAVSTGASPSRSAPATCPGINAVIMGAALAAGKLGWEMVGIRDGFDGVLHPERYPDGGLVTLSPAADREPGPDRGRAPRPGGPGRPVPRPPGERGRAWSRKWTCPMSFWPRLQAENIDAVISVVGGRGLSILYKLHRKGLNTVCVPRSIENDIAATSVSFGFNTALSFTIEMLDRVRQAAQSARKIGVVEVLGDAGRMAGAAGRHRRVRRCGADPRDPLRPAGGGGEAEGQGDRPAGPGGWWWWPKGRRSSRTPQARGQAAPPSRPPCRRWPRVTPASTSSGGRARPPRPWRAGCSC